MNLWDSHSLNTERDNYLSQVFSWRRTEGKQFLSHVLLHVLGDYLSEGMWQ